MKEGMSDREYKYVEGKLKSIDRIGKQKAAKIISLVDCFEEIIELNKEDIAGIKRSSGSSIFNEKKSKEIIKVLKKIDAEKDIIILEVEEIISSFMEKIYEKINNIDLDILDINPFLIRALKFDEADEVIKFYLYQTITRSIVTSWGMNVEKLAITGGAEEIHKDENVQVSGKKFDIKKVSEGKTYYIQVKSGPNTMNIGMIESLNDMIKKIEEKDKNNVGILGMTYGNRDKLSSQISGSLDNVEERTKIGKEFWNFISTRKNYTEELLKIISDAAERYEVKNGSQKLSDLIDEKYEILLEQWGREYGSTGKESIKKVEKLNL